jgi:MFS family permease
MLSTRRRSSRNSNSSTTTTTTTRGGGAPSTATLTTTARSKARADAGPPPTLPDAAAASSSEPNWIPAVGLSALAAMICAIDRAALSVAILPMAEAYSWPDSTKGLVAASFYVGYTAFNLAGGVWATQRAAKRVLGAGVVVWSAFTLATPLAAGAPALPVLLATRALMGAGEGVTFPSVQALVRGWVPPDGRSRALTLTYAAAQLGTVVALLTAPLIISAHGWEAVFYVYGSFGFAWSLLWWPLVADAPPALAASPPPQQQQQQQASLAASLAALPWRDFFASKPFLAILISHAAFGVGHYVTLTWLPSFYAQRYDLDVASAALLSVFPWVLGVAVSSLSGVAADALSNRGLASTGAARKLMQGVGAVGPALCLAWLALADAGAESAGDAGAGVPVGQAAVALTLAISLAGFQSAGFASNHQDIAARYAPVLFGITNAMSSLLGTASVYGVGAVLDAYGRPESGWAAVWAGLAACYVVGAAVFLRWSSSERQFE